MAIKLTSLFVFVTHIVCAQAWVQLADFPALERDDGVAVAVNNKAYFGTGLQAGFSLAADFYALDLATNTWGAIAAMPAGMQRQYATAFCGQGCFYILAGDGNNGFSTDLQKYDIATNTWSSCMSKPGNGLMGMCSMAFGDKVILAGGKFQNGTVNDEVWEYTISTNTWLQKNNFPFGGRWRAGAAVLNNTGYLLFGVDGANRLRRELYAYDHTNDVWTKVNDFPFYGRAYAAVQNVGSRLLAFGGLDSLNVYHNDVWQFDPAVGNWNQQPALPSYGRKGGMSIASGDKFYYSCGVTATDRIKQSWMMDVPVGIKENNKPALFSVFPNPVNDLLYLSFDKRAEINEVVLVDISGREIKKTIADIKTTNTIQLDLGDLESGIYFLKVSSKTDSEFKKIMKN